MRKTMGFPISKKENEKRRVLIPDSLSKIMNCDCLYFEKGYGDILGISDTEYLEHGAHIGEREEILNKEIICDLKIGDAEYLTSISNQTIFGWVHAVQNRYCANILIKNKITAFAWENMHEEGRHVFWKNNEIAGEAAVLHAFECYGDMPYNAKVAIIGMGNVGFGASKILAMLGAEIKIYNRKTEKLLRRELSQFDVVVNAVLWDVSRQDHIIYKEDLKHMKKGAMIIDISCDRSGGIESCIPTTISHPVYYMDGILHYAVDHTPALLYKVATRDISNSVAPYIDKLCENIHCNVLEQALSVKSGIILDHKINEYQCRKMV